MNISMMDELKALMTGELGCDDMNLFVYVNYCNNRINSMKPFVNEIEEKKIQTPSILEIKNIFTNKIQQFEEFLNWCRTERKIIC